MSSSAIFINRLRGLPVNDSGGNQVGKVRDVVVESTTGLRTPAVKGFVVELFAKHRIFVPMLRIHWISAEQVVITGLVDTRPFRRRQIETLVIDDLFGRRVSLDGGEQVVVVDLSMRETRAHSWELHEVAVQAQPTRPFGRKGALTILDWAQVPGLSTNAAQVNDVLVAQLEEMKPADVARELHDLTPARRAEVAAGLNDEVLADALEELPEDEQILLISALQLERAADVLEEMDPDDAADLIADLEPAKAEELLAEMQPEDAADVRQLLSFGEFTAGGMMTPEPIVVSADATVADALARIRNQELTPALASMVFVCRSPLDTPTGRYLGGVHFQRLLREPPSSLVGTLLDETIEALPSDAPVGVVSRYFATYNLVVAPVVDGERHLLGAVTVDDVLDHMLPADWRGAQMDAMPDEIAPEVTRG